MRTILSGDNPFRKDGKALLWEHLTRRPARNLLDFGAHDGAMIQTLVASGRALRAAGVEAAAEVVEAAQPRLSPNVRLTHLPSKHPLPFPDRSFDVATIVGVLEHLADQDFVLRELGRVLEDDGSLLVSVPGKNVFSFLDMGNWKFVFPRAHQLYYTLAFSEEKYRERYVECKNGLIGDVEVAKRWHEHFSHRKLSNLLARNHFSVTEADGAGLLIRPLLLAAMGLPSAVSPRIQELIKWDARTFHSAEIFVLAKKSR